MLNLTIIYINIKPVGLSVRCTLATVFEVSTMQNTRTVRKFCVEPTDSSLPVYARCRYYVFFVCEEVDVLYPAAVTETKPTTSTESDSFLI